MASRIAAYDRAVYQWEHVAVLPHDQAVYDEQLTRTVVNHVWQSEGLLNPPKVIIDHRMGLSEGLGNRMEVTFGPATRLSVILHELAHAMDFSLESSMGMGQLASETPGTVHDANWMGLYVKLLDRYIGGIHFNLFYLWASLNKAGLEFSVNPMPRCI